MHARVKAFLMKMENGREGSTDDDMSMPIPPFSHIEEHNACFDSFCTW